MNKFPLVIMVLLVSWTTAFADITIKGPENPTVQEETAVKELKHYLDMSLRRGLELDGSTKVVFHVGDTEFARKHRLDSATLSEDQYLMRSVSDQIILVGGGSRGTLYAVYRFLEEFLDIHWWTPTAETVPVYEDVLKLKPFNKTITPAFALRNIYPDNTTSKDSGRFAVRNRLNSFGDHEISSQYGGPVRFGSPYSVHTFDKYMPVSEYMKDHPEYFSLSGGKRIGGQRTGQLCLTNQEVVAEFVRKIKEYIVKDEALAASTGVPAPTLYDISQNDNPVMCQCEQCAKVVAQEGANSGLIIRFVNQIAAAVKEFRPNYWVSTLAYMSTEHPPQKTRPLNNVIIRLCNTTDNKTASIWASEQTSFRQKVIDWQEISPAIYIWEYSVNYGPAQPPYPSEYYLSDKLNFYKAHNVKFMFMEHEFPEKGDMYFMKTWLETKLLEDPNADSEELITIFLNGYYGQAGPYIKKYREVLRESVRRHNSYFYKFLESCTYLDLETITKSFECFEQAEKAVCDAPVLLGRIQRDKFNLMQAVLVRYRKLTEEWMKHGRDLAEFPWSQEKLFAEIKNQWKKNIATYTVEKYRPERLAEIDKFQKTYGNFPDVTGVPKRFKEWTDGTIDMTVDLAETHGHPLVQDPESEAGFAVFVDLSKTDKKEAVPLDFGIYSTTRAQKMNEGVILPSQIKKPGYNYYYCTTVTPEFSGYVHFLWDWRVQFTLDSAAAQIPGRRYKVYVSAKFSGTPYPHSSKNEPWGIYIDRCLLVPCSK